MRHSPALQWRGLTRDMIREETRGGRVTDVGRPKVVYMGNQWEVAWGGAQRSANRHVRKGMQVAGKVGDVTHGLMTALLVTLSMFLCVGSPVAAQTDGLLDKTTYVSLATGERFTWTDDWTYDEAGSSATPDGELILLNGPIASVLFTYGAVGIDMDAERDALIDLFFSSADASAEVDRGAYDGVSYSLDKVLTQDVELGIFTLFVERRTDVLVTMVIAGADFFAEGVQDAQDAIAIDGVAALAGIAPAGLQDALTASAPLTADGTSGETPVPTAAVEPTDVATEEAVGHELSGIGVIEEGRYESPNLGVGITWTEDWLAYRGSTDPAANEDELTVVVNPDTHPDLDGYITFRLSATDEMPITIDELDAYIGGGQAFAGSDYDLIFSDASTDEVNAVVYREDDELGTIVGLAAGKVLDDGEIVLFVEAYGGIADAPALLTLIQGGILIDGEPIATVLDANAFVSLLADLPGGESLANVDPAPTPADRASWEELGVVQNGEYESPQHGVDITWADDWDVLGVTSDRSSGSDEVSLTLVDPEGASTITVYKPEQPTADDDIEDSYLAWAETNALTVLDSGARRDEAWIVMQGTTDAFGDSIIVEIGVVLDDGETVVLIGFRASIDDVEELIGAIQSDVTVEGEPVGQRIDPDVILDALAA